MDIMDPLVITPSPLLNGTFVDTPMSTQTDSFSFMDGVAQSFLIVLLAEIGDR